MAEQKNPPPNAVKGGVVAYLSLDGAIKAGDFYKKAFAAEEVFVQPPDDKGRTMHLHLYINGSSVMMSDPYPEHGHPHQALGIKGMLIVGVASKPGETHEIEHHHEH